MQDLTLVTSPSVMMNIIDRIEVALWERFNSFQGIERYIRRWRKAYGHFNIVPDEYNDTIDVHLTLDEMEDELLFKIAVDLNVEVPGLIYSVAEIKGVLAGKYEDAGQAFERAYGKIFSEPSTAIIMANSALERIIKDICKDPALNSCKSKDTLYKLTSHILKQFNFFPDRSLNENIQKIGSGLLSASQAIESLRSNNTEAHGTEDEIIADPLYAMLVVNAVSTIGLFFLNYYEKKHKSSRSSWLDEDVPF